MRLPSSLALPLPAAMTLPCCGFSLAESGMMIPPIFCSPSSRRWTMMRSCSGLTFMLSSPSVVCGLEVCLPLDADSTLAVARATANYMAGWHCQAELRSSDVWQLGERAKAGAAVPEALPLSGLRPALDLVVAHLAAQRVAVNAQASAVFVRCRRTARAPGR